MSEVKLIIRKDFPCSNCPKDNKVVKRKDEFNSNYCPICMEVINYESPEEEEQMTNTTGKKKISKAKKKKKKTDQLKLDL